MTNDATDQTVLFRPASPPTDPAAADPGVHPESTVLEAGSVHSKHGLPLPCDLYLDRDVLIPLRDGTELRADVWRPDRDSALATVLTYTPYGKAGGYWGLDNFPFRANVPRRAVSGLQSFEAPDPAYWCHQGYAVVVVDARGSYHSGGDLRWWGTVGAHDGYDVVEWIAEQPWSTGRIGMTGNSQLAIIQWFIAAARPPHLTAIAPWEGLTDMYRDNLARGGIPFPEFNEDVLTHQYGNRLIEDIPAMIARDPLLNDYWRDKAARVEDIEIPAYVVASYTNALHAGGTLDAFRRLPTDRKWLRIHNTMEWPDYYEPRNVEDLRRFFDHHLRDIDNGWHNTPTVRAAVLDLGGTDEVDRPMKQWPPLEVEHRALHLDAATGRLSSTPVEAASSVAYDADGTGKATFTVRLTEDAETAGYGSVRLWMEADGADDMDVFVLVEKLSRRGSPRYRVLMRPPVRAMETVMNLANRLGLLKVGFIFYRGLTGQLRASQRALDTARSTPDEPRHLHISEERLRPGMVVPVDIPLWPAMLRWHRGEQLRITVAGHDPRGPWFPHVTPPKTRNRGRHRIHTGGSYDSHLRLPFTSLGSAR